MILAKRSVCFLGVLIFWIIGVDGAGGKTTPPTQPDILVGLLHSPEGKSLYSERKRRDPFKRIKKHNPTPGISKKSSTEPTGILSVKDPVWKLLGVIHGKDGHRAVIQLSPKERVFVRPGTELAQTGWTIKTISEQEVLLEHLSPSIKTGHSSPPRKFILSFPTSQKSP